MAKRVIVRISAPSRWEKNYLVESLKQSKLPSVRYVEGSDEVVRDENIVAIVSNNLSKEDCKKLPNLRYLIIPASGTEGVDHDVVKGRGITIIQDKEIASSGVVEYVYEQLKQLSKDKLRSYLKGKTIGLLGYGHVGKEIYERLSKYGLKWEIMKEDPSTLGRELGIKFVGNKDSLEGILSDSDIIINALPLNSETKGLLADKTYMIKRGALIINVSRSGIMNEKQILDGVVNGQFSGAIFDVYPKNINTGDYSNSNIVLTPHIAGIYGKALNEMVGFIKRSVKKVLRR